jgi:putative ABC transport system permease protein
MSLFSQGNLKVAIASLRKAKWRSLLTMLGVIIGIVSVVTIVGIGEGMKRQVTDQIDHFGKDLIMVRPGHVSEPDAKKVLSSADMLFGRTALSGLSQGDFKTLKATAGVTKAAPLGVISGEVRGPEQTVSDNLIIATSPDLPAVLNQPVKYGGFFEDDSDVSSAVIGQQVAYELFGQSVPLGKTFTLRNQSFTVRGIFDDFNAPPLSPTANFDNAIFIPYQMADQITKNSTQFYALLAKPASTKQVEPTVKNIEQSLSGAHGGQNDFSVLDHSRSVVMSGGIIDLLTTFVTAVAAISLVVGGIGIMNIMLVSVTERMHEIGIRKAIGATNRQIMQQFLLESIVLSGMGGVLGIVFSIIINILLHTYTTLQPIISIQAIIVATGVSVAVGVIFGTAPAIKAATKDPIEALRHE